MQHSLTLADYAWSCVMFLLGQILHLMWVKIPSIKKKAAANNKKFLFDEWLAEDWNLIIGLNVFAMMLFIGLDQILHFKPEIIDYVRWFFAFIGSTGSSIAMRYSKYDGNLLKMLDIKSNIAGAIIGETQSVQETIDKGSAATGQDMTKAPQ